MEFGKETLGYCLVKAESKFRIHKTL